MENIEEKINNLFDEYLDWRLMDMPEIATMFGVHTYNDRLNDLSLERFEERYEKTSQFLSTAERLERNLPDDKHLKRNFYALKYELETFQRGYQYKGFYMPICGKIGPHNFLPIIFDAMPLDNQKDYENLLSRLKQIQVQFDQIIQLMKKGVENKITRHKIEMHGLSEVLNEFITSKMTDHPLFKYFKKKPPNLNSEIFENLRQRAEEVLINKISPSYLKLKNYIEHEYVFRDDTAISSITNGKSFYQEIIRFHTSSQLTPKEIQEIGYSEVKRIWNELIKIGESHPEYKNLPVEKFISSIKSNPDNFYSSEIELLSEARNEFETVMKKLPGLFETMPSTSLLFEGDPSPISVYGQHIPGSFKDNRPATFKLKTYNIHTFPRYCIRSLSLHEGIPGHYLHYDFKKRDHKMHCFRKLNYDFTLMYSPSTFPNYMFYNEGWALYAESLGVDMDLYDDPLDRFGCYGEELLRSCRLVVDTGLHAFGWSREKALHFMHYNCIAHKNLVEEEVDRYVMLPGQALSYKMGQLKIRELRKRAEVKLGNDFNIKNFHELILACYGSFEFLEQDVDDWIKSEGASKVKFG